jgi:hypothetical protein
MKTYYSHIYYSNNNHFDKMSVGLIFFDGKNVFIEINKEKLNIVKKLNKKGFKLFKFAVEKFKEYYLENGITLKEVERLSVYHNNMFQVTPPIKIDLECTKENFDRYFEKVCNLY